MKYLLLIVGFFFLLLQQSYPQQSGRPKIGITLSGGGAKGLAHIGILKAIDSAGLKIDYITGTSMGAIIGGLYAIGYSGDSLEKITRKIDWDLMLSNQASLRSLFMEEKDEYSKYVVELPWERNHFNIPIGVLEGQEIWLRLAELFFPVYDQKDFSKFNIPFRCIGTEIGEGEAVVMQKGEIVNAVRASMAIPSLFTAVNYEGKVLVDGGVVRNFPVKDVREMGADIVIGSNVAGGLLPSDKVKSAFQLLFQVAFFREAAYKKEEIQQCNIYVPFNLDKYTMVSFNQAHEITKIGIEEGRKLYPRFKEMADSLNAIYGTQEFQKERVPPEKKVSISSYEVRGTGNTTIEFFIHTMNFLTNKEYTAADLSRMVRQAYGTRYYSRISYHLLPLPDGTAKIVFDVIEHPLTFAKLGVHYNRFTGIGVIGNITSRNFLTPNSRSLATINIGETFRIRGEHLQYFGRQKNVSLILNAQFDRFDVVTYEQFKRDGLYHQNYFKFDSRLQFTTGRNMIMGAGSKVEWIQYNPTISSGLELKGSNTFSSYFGYVAHNSLNKNIFPRKGVKFDAELGWVDTQSPRVKFLLDGKLITNQDSIEISRDPYLKTTVNLESYTPFGMRTVLMLGGQAGINFNYEKNLMNEYVVGGLTKLFRNQILFAGMQEGTVYTPAVATIHAGLRHQLFNNTYVTGRANVMFNNFVSRSAFFNNPDFFSGYALTFSYNFALGPLDISAMYCDQTKRIQSYINLGISF